MKRVVMVVAALACASCVGGASKPAMVRTVSVEHESSWVPVAADPLLERIRRLARRSARGGKGEGGGAAWGLGPDLTAGWPDEDELSGGVLLRQPAPPGSSLPDMPLGRSQRYTAAPGDVLDVVVGGRPEFSGRMEVRSDGKVVLPTAGDLIDVVGLTADEVAERFAAAVHPKYLRSRPDVSVQFVSSPRWVYYVVGAVAREGRMRFTPGRVRLLDALIAAGGVSRGEGGGFFLRGRRSAAWRSVRIVTPTPAGPEVMTVDVEALVRGESGRNVLIRPGQIIFVPSGDDPRDELLFAEVLGGRNPHAGEAGEDPRPEE